jgi:hypothetical protein
MTARRTRKRLVAELKLESITRMLDGRSLGAAIKVELSTSQLTTRSVERFAAGLVEAQITAAGRGGRDAAAGRVNRRLKDQPRRPPRPRNLGLGLALKTVSEGILGTIVNRPKAIGCRCA